MPRQALDFVVAETHGAETRNADGMEPLLVAGTAPDTDLAFTHAKQDSHLPSTQEERLNG